MKSSRGFTVIEIIIVVAILGVASVLFFMQKAAVEIASRDEVRKTAINSMHYSLEEVYFKEHKNYPRTITKENLPSVAPELFNDPDGVLIGESDSNYRYEPTDCSDSGCKSYTLRTILENEDDYIKNNRTEEKK